MEKKQIVKAKRSSAFPPVALAYLRNAGWMPDRAVPISSYEEAYMEEGLPLVLKTRTFLRGFGGLMIRYVTKSQQQDVLEFLAERAVLGMGHGAIESFEERIGVTPLCPIGHCFFGTCILLMDAKGRVFGGSDETVTLVGKTGRKAIGHILTGKEGDVLWFNQNSSPPCPVDPLTTIDGPREKKRRLK